MTARTTLMGIIVLLGAIPDFANPRLLLIHTHRGDRLWRIAFPALINLPFAIYISVEAGRHSKVLVPWTSQACKAGNIPDKAYSIILNSTNAAFEVNCRASAPVSSYLWAFM